MTGPGQPQTCSHPIFQVDCKTLKGYTFSSFCLMGRYLKKICLEECTITLAVPWWHSQAWFPALMESLVKPPLLLPYCRDLLRDPLNQFHLLAEQGHLRLFSHLQSIGEHHTATGIQRKLQTSCWQDGAKIQHIPVWVVKMDPLV